MVTSMADSWCEGLEAERVVTFSSGGVTPFWGRNPNRGVVA